MWGNEQQVMDVYTVRSLSFGHEAVVLTTSNNILRIEVGTGKTPMHISNISSSKWFSTMQQSNKFAFYRDQVCFHGSVVMSLKCGHQCAFLALRKWGRFSIIKNCQNFCSLLLKELGL